MCAYTNMHIHTHIHFFQLLNLIYTCIPFGLLFSVVSAHSIKHVSSNKYGYFYLLVFLTIYVTGSSQYYIFARGHI